MTTVINVIRVQDSLPADNQYVLCHLRGSADWVVAEFKRGISAVERSGLSDTNPRRQLIYPSDEYGNNRRPYCWEENGPCSYFGQDVDFWAALPEMKSTTYDCEHAVENRS